MSNLKFEKEILQDVFLWNFDEIYNFFGSKLEDIVKYKKEEYKTNLKFQCKHRTNFVFKDTNQKFDKHTMLIYFDIKKIDQYSIRHIELILRDLENETIFNNPKLL